jgi:hypothetical protein
MQTFLPEADFTLSARTLDWQRLGNQCYRECKTLYNGGWKNHPASKMWVGYENALARYGLALAYEMAGRVKDDGTPKWKDEVVRRWITFWQDAVDETEDTGNPPWLGDKAFHDAHKSNLIRKDANHYRQFWPDIPDDLEYVWPV